MSQRVPSFSPYWNDWENDFSTMYNTDWNAFDFKNQKIVGQDFQLDGYGLNCGVPSRTTPTLTSVTPTTLRSLEQTFSDYQPEAESHQNEAGFVPPLVQSSSIPTSVHSTSHDNVSGGSIFMNIVDTKSWQGGTTTISEMPSLMHIHPNSLSPPIPTAVLSMGSSSSSSSSTSSTSSRKNIGGRRPNKENGISPEEEERRKLRRERNKLAAARCRKRRLDHTNELVEETNEWEGKKQRLQEEIQKLKMEKQELEFLLETHQPHCRLRDTDSPEDIKPFTMNTMLNDQLHGISKSAMNIVTSSCDTKVYTSMGIPVSGDSNKMTMTAPRQRPNTLPVSNSFMPKSKLGFSEMAGIAISTPSNGLTLNFESLMDGGTGLTPITSSFIPSCSTQLRNANGVDLSSPDSLPTKLVSL